MAPINSCTQDAAANFLVNSGIQSFKQHLNVCCARENPGAEGAMGASFLS